MGGQDNAFSSKCSVNRRVHLLSSIASCCQSNWAPGALQAVHPYSKRQESTQTSLSSKLIEKQQLSEVFIATVCG